MSKMENLHKLDKVKVLNETYKVKFMTGKEIFKDYKKKEGFKLDLDFKPSGLFHSDSSTIYVNNETTLSRQITTLWHEIYHAVVYEYGSDGRENEGEAKFNEELIVDTFSQATLKLFKDNPELIKVTSRIAESI